MDQEQRDWFDALTSHRSKGADWLDEPFMRGVQGSVVDKYSDQAHFIYELLQNADDVKATSARFRLEKDGLFFIHDGSVRFTISNPQSEGADTGSGALGHINAITSIANSNKTEEPSKIGKFGVGFKAVFQYTQTPHIYDPEVWFKIERFIVPHRLDSDLKWRQPSETVFFFPFNHKTKQPKESYSEILEKLKALEFPVLFLSSLESVSFETEEVTGKYTKEVTRKLEQGDITVQWLMLAMELNGARVAQRLLVFTRNNGHELPCCIGYALGENEKLVPINRPAFCFFPTKEATNLNFILHAPFLLNDSREGIKAGEEHNRELIQLLAQLAADSFPILRDEKLIDDGILEIIPYREAGFSEMNDRNNISFKPFHTAIRNKLQTDELLPSTCGLFAKKGNSYWASVPRIAELFSNKQLALLMGNQDGCWVFTSIGRDEHLRTKKALVDYIDTITDNWLDQEDILAGWISDNGERSEGASASFIENQPHEWLFEFYQWLSESTKRTALVKDKPIFLDQDGNAVSAYDNSDQLILFLPDDGIDGYTTIKKELLSNKPTCEFIEKLGIKKPSLRDEIYNKILPKYKLNNEIDTTLHFAKFFRYFKECKHVDINEFIELISDKAFLEYVTADGETVYHGKASDIYFPTSELKAWFETKPDTKFLQFDKYREMVGVDDFGRLDEFFRQLGIASIPRVVDATNDKKIDGLDELLSRIESKYSEVIWNMLSRSWDRYEGAMQVLKQHFGPRGGYKGSSWRDSSVNRDLRTKSWVINSLGHLCSVEAVTVQALFEKYDTTSTGAIAFIRFLGIRDELQDTAHLSEDEKRLINLGKRLENVSDDELEKLDEFLHKMRRQFGPIGDSSLADSPLIRDITSRRPSVKDSNLPSQPVNPPAQPSDESEDADDYTPKSVDYGKKLDRAKDRYASELDRIEREQALHGKANALPRYSYGWFLALLELECMTSSEKNADGKTISISFGKVEQDNQSSRTIVLKKPSRFIPQSIEEFSGVRVDLDFSNGLTGKLHIESFTAKEFSLLGKLESADELSGLVLDEVVEARIEVQNPSFLLQELLERFRELRLEETLDMKANLTSDIEFVFGPPGTGKTTHLAERVLIPLMQGIDQARVLVLTPTNKAADVLTNRIIEKMDGDTSYLNWLVRFGTSADERIEKAGVWRDRSFDIGALSRFVTVTTIARFAYDGFAGEHGKKLYEMKWDAIVFDEASMISLASIIYPLYRKKPQKFIVAGDPFQIEPIVAVEQWKDENIYTLVGLNKPGSFAQPATEPHAYQVTNLETQYRSIPAIGTVFSDFTYDGSLKHYRTANSQRPLQLNRFDAKSINLIKFPVSKYESIYRAKRLESGTPYQTYSALFTFEFVRWLAGQIQVDRAEKYRIGVIAPYRAQANLLNKLNDSWVAKPDAVEIQVGTIHGFQGDECDIVIAVFNPPPSISTSPQMFLNKQDILNVAISRARDYLFIVMPDDETENLKNLRRIAKIENLVKAGEAFSEYPSHTIEELIWGNANYLEENTFSTGHQMVNVYLRPERYYEVRSDDSAIDVQIHESY